MGRDEEEIGCLTMDRSAGWWTSLRYRERERDEIETDRER
jgi:hypothetical protein